MPVHPSSPARRRCLAVATTGLGLTAAALAPLAALPTAQAAPAGHLVISEAYGGGGNAGATYTHDFVELHNPTSAPVSLAGWSVQYRSATGTTAQVTPLHGSIAPGATYLVQMARGSGGTTPLPSPDATGSTAMSGTAGQVVLASSSAPQAPTAPRPSTGAVVDFLGWGAAAVAEGTPAPGTTNATSVARGDSAVDTDDNAADFVTGAPTPAVAVAADPFGADAEVVTIAEVQGDGATSPYAGRAVRTTGVVTAVYATGGYNGLYLQTDGTGGAVDATPGRSDAVFVYGSRLDEGDYALGQLVEVTGEVSEFAGTTEITPAGPRDVEVLDAPVAGVTPLATTVPRTGEAREAHEGELLAPQGPFTVSDSYDTNRYAEVLLAAGTEPLVQPTDVVDAQDEAAVAAVAADNAARAITMDDGASTDFFRAQDVALPWLTAPDGTPRPVRVGAPVTFTEPVVLEFRNGRWKLQPTTQYTADEQPPALIEDTREAAPEDVGGDLRLATFNVLNYFSTTGEEFVAAGGSCTYYTDRAGDPVTNRRCEPDGPRGAAEAEDLERQQAKIVAAINALDAGIVSLEEIENSVALGADRDEALAALVRALDAEAGAGTWAFVRSPEAAALPPVERQDVIRTAFVYQPALVRPIGASQVLDHQAFGNARQPLAQLFRPVGARGKAKFAVVVNHFKSKGSGRDDGTGQGNANPDRIAQAEALADFAAAFAREKGTDRVFLTGDFNSYTQEDPMEVLYAAGYTNLESDFGGADGRRGEATYSYDGLSGSLDHVLASPAALEMVTGVDVWGINAGESVAFEYSRHNYNLTQFWAPDPFRSSDHDPELVGLDTTVR